MKTLQTISLPELTNWSVQYLLKNNFSYNQNFTLIAIGNFLTRNKTVILVEDDKNYKRVTVRAKNKGVCLRDTERGKKIGTKKQFSIKEGQFLLSKIDARNGAFGVVPKEVDNAIITGNFWTFDVNDKLINPHFLALMVTTPEFIKFSENASNGTTNRHYLQETLFLAQKIPLPSLEEQNRIVANYNTKVQLAKKQEEKAKQLELDIENYLFEVLGIEQLEEKENKKGLQFVDYKNTDRWDTLFLIGNIPSLISKYPISKYGDVITNFNKGKNGKSIRINSKDYPDENFHYIGMEHIEKETGRLLKLNVVKGKEIKSQTLRVPKEYLLYGKLRPYLNKYWLNETNYDDIICTSEFFVFDIKPTINKQFFKNIMSSNFIQVQISDKTSGARMPRINETMFFNLQFPLPPIEIQNKIGTHIASLKQQIQDLKNQAEQNRTKAIQEFEQEIFITD